MLTRITISCLLTLMLISTTAVAGPYYARGSFYAGTVATWGYDSGNELSDDGLHGDGAAGDGVFGAFVIADQDPGPHEWKIATPDWTENYPNHPVYSLSNALLFLMDWGEVIHFRLDTNTLEGGWQPATNAVACSHFGIPLPGFEFELIGSPPELGEWLYGVPVLMMEDLWVAYATIASPGHHEYKFRIQGTWEFSNLGVHYNMLRGDNFTFETTDPMSSVRFEFNPNDGRSRVIFLGSVPVETTSWGEVKALHR